MSYSGPYGSVAGVSAYIAHMRLDAANNPTTASVETWLTQRCAQLTAWLTGAGYSVPVVEVNATAILDRYACLGAACDAELSLWAAGWNKDDANARETTFCAQFAEAAAWIAGPALGNLGVPQTLSGTLAHQPQIGVITAGSVRDTTRMLPREWRP